MANIKEVTEYFDEILPKTLSEPYDNDGAMVIPDQKIEIKKVLIALDATSLAIEHAKNIGAQLIITHHPLVFKPLSSLTANDAYGKRVIECIKNNLAVLSYHTRLDEAEGGVCDCLAKKAGLCNIKKMQPCGRIGKLPEKTSYDNFAEHIKNLLGIKFVYGTNSKKAVKNVAVVSGSGKNFIFDAKNAGADTFLTGEVNHSGLIEGKELGLNIICATHYATENVVLGSIKEFLLEKFPSLTAEILHFKAEDEYGI